MEFGSIGATQADAVAAASRCVAWNTTAWLWFKWVRRRLRVRGQLVQGSYTFWSMDFQDFKSNFHDQTEISV